MNCSLSYLSEALRASFATPQHLAEALGCPRNSAWRYWHGHSIPNVTLLARLMRQSRGFTLAVGEYLGLDHASLDAEAARLRADYAVLQHELAAVHAEFERFVAAHSGDTPATTVPANQGAVGEGAPADAPGEPTR